MIKLYFKQIKQLWKSNSLFSVISVLATAFTIAFVMMFYMVYAFRTANIAPEINRSRVLYSDIGYSYMTKDLSHSNRGMSKSAAKTIFGNLKNAETVSYILNKGEGAAYVGTSPSNQEKRIVSPVDDKYFQIFKFEFINGKPFNSEQIDAQRKDVIITDKLALKLFNNVNVIGKTVTIQFVDYRITGVVKSVSSLFNKAYSDLWIVADREAMDFGQQYSEGLLGMCQVIVLVKKGASLQSAEKEIDENLKKLNSSLREYTFEQNMISHPQSSFFGKKKIHPSQIFITLILILLIVPAINMSGLLSTQMKKRSEEIAIRKTYGASNGQISYQLLFENFTLTLAGGIIGLILSYITIIIFKSNILSDIMTVNASENFQLPVSMFFNPVIYLLVFAFCLIINLLSAIIPVWNASRTSIIDTMKGE